MFSKIRIISTYKNKHILYVNKLFQNGNITKEEKDKYMIILSRFKDNKIDIKQLNKFKKSIIKAEEYKNKPVTNPEVKPEVNPEVKPEVNPEVKPEVNPEVNPEVKSEVNPVVKPEVNPEVKMLIKTISKFQDKPVPLSSKACKYPIKYNRFAKYLYIYNDINNKPYSKLIEHFMKALPSTSLINVVPFEKIKYNELINYKVICVDYLIIYHTKIKQNINIFYLFLKRLKNLDAKICFIMHDLHSYTFLNHKLKTNILINKKIYANNDYGRPLLKKTEGICELIKQFSYGNIQNIISYYECPELNNIKKYS